MYLEELDRTLTRITDHEPKVCVIGVGTIGLPLATFLASKGFYVTGLDINPKRVEQINSGTVVYEYAEMLKQVTSEGKLKATIDTEKALENVEVLFICVPTPLDDKNELDIYNLFDVAKRISPHLKKGMILIFESSVAIGTTKKISKHIEDLTGLKFGNELGLAYCPERYNPTPSLKKGPHDLEFNVKARGESFTLDEIGRVIGGIDSKSTKIAQAFYSQFITASITELSSIEAAEATKLLENIFRDVNIALVNELAKIYPKLGLNIFEIIDAANTKPFAFMPHYPGAGVGGECIPVDTWYLISQAKKLGIDTKLLKTARQVNDSMPEHMIAILENELRKFNKEIGSSKISILGLCYKKNLSDTRLSPTFPIIELLSSKNAEVIVCDPVCENISSTIKCTPISETFKNSDAILLVTDHNEFATLDFEKIKNEMRTPIVIDGRNFFSNEKLTSLGFNYKAIGKP